MADIVPVLLVLTVVYAMGHFIHEWWDRRKGRKDQ